MYLGLDSDQYPLKTYGDLAFRLYGPVVRHGFNFLQSVQLLCNVGVIIVSNGQALSQVSKFRLCYGRYPQKAGGKPCEAILNYNTYLLKLCANLC